MANCYVLKIIAVRSINMSSLFRSLMNLLGFALQFVCR